VNEDFDGINGRVTGSLMAARDFINETLLPWLEEQIAAEAQGSQHYIRGVEDAMKALVRFVELHRDEWDVPE
jgi:hypothetical protein